MKLLAGSAHITYAKGFSAKEDKMEGLSKEALQIAREAEVAVIFAGLPDSFESEGYDRKHMRLPDCQNQLIEEVCSVQPNTIVVLHNGSPVEMPWAGKVMAILELYLGGQGVGKAAASLLFGEVNPSGKLAETFPVKLEDNPSYLNFPGDGKRVEYREGIYIGYRYYDKKRMEVLFPFGHGLSYTNFVYSDLEVDKTELTEGDTLKVKLKVSNTGDRAGKEVVQLYVSDQTGLIQRPEKELKDFAKVHLEPGETKEIKFTLGKRSFAWYNTEIKDWYCGTGNYEILAGASSRDIRLRETVCVTAQKELPIEVHENTTFGELMKHPKTRPAIEKLMEKYQEAFGGEQSEAASEAITEEMNQQMFDSMPIRALRSFQGMTRKEMEALIMALRKGLQ